MTPKEKEEALQAAIARFTAPGMHRWMKNQKTLAEALSCASALLRYGVDATGSSRLDLIPNELLGSILLFATTRDKRTRARVLAVCRRFHCIVVQNGDFYVDLASFPGLPALFMDYLCRGEWKDRPFELLLDDDNYFGYPIPPAHCLLAGVPRCSVIRIKHSVGSSETVKALARAGSNPYLRELTITSPGVWVRFRPRFESNEDVLSAVPVLYAPNLRRFHIRQAHVDLPGSTLLKDVLIDCGAHDHFTPGGTRNGFPPSVLHSLLKRNPGIVNLELREPIDGSTFSLETDEYVVPLRALQHFEMVFMYDQHVAWLLKRVEFSPSSYCSLSVGQHAKKTVDLRSAARNLVYKLQGRTFNNIIVVEAKGCTTIMLNGATREWKMGHGAWFRTEMESLGVLTQGKYLPASGSVDFVAHTSRKDPRIRWPEILLWMSYAGLNLSGIKSLELRTDFPGDILPESPVLARLGGVEALRLWPKKNEDVKDVVHRLCGDPEQSWNVASKRFASIFTGLCDVFDVPGKRGFRAEHVDHLLDSIFYTWYQETVHPS